MSIRERQVASIRQYAPQIRQERQGDDSRWVLAIQDKQSLREILKVSMYLPPSFPSVAPQISVLPAATHPWIDRNGILSAHPHLSAWNPNYNTGVLVNDILTELIKLAQSLKASYPTAQVIQPVTSYPQQQVSAMQAPQVVSQMMASQAVTAPSYYAPTAPLTVGSPRPEEVKITELSSFTDDELRALVSDDFKLDSFVSECGLITEQRAMLDSLIDSNKQVAEGTLQVKEEVTGCRSLLSEDLNVYRNLFNETKELREGRPEPTRMQTLQLLNKKISELQASSESLIAHKPIMDIKTDYLALRKELHRLASIKQALQANSH